MAQRFLGKRSDYFLCQLIGTAKLNQIIKRFIVDFLLVILVSCRFSRCRILSRLDIGSALGLRRCALALLLDGKLLIAFGLL